MKQKFHFVYKTEHLPSGRFYLGKHTTSLVKSIEDDTYLGSGVVWRKILKAHPIEEFKRTIISEHKTSKEAFDAEKLLITEALLCNLKCMNMVAGGLGGHGNAANFYARETPAQIAKKGAETLKANPEKLAERNKKIAEKAKTRPQEYSNAKAELMRANVTPESRKKQGSALSKSKNEKMTKFLLDLIPYRGKTVPELCKMYPDFSHSSIARARTLARRGKLKWEHL